MENKETIVPTLYHSTSLKIAHSIWNQPDVRDLAFQFEFSLEIISYDQRRIEWQSVEQEALNKLISLPLPDLLKEELSCFVAGVGWEILTWKVNHKSLIKTSTMINNFSKFVWTGDGTIDLMKTALVFLKDKSMSINSRFKLACKYCSERYASIFWRKSKVKEGCHYSLIRIRICDSEIIQFWAHFFERQLSQIAASMQSKFKEINLDRRVVRNIKDEGIIYAFYNVILELNEVAACYLMEKISPEIKKLILVNVMDKFVKKHFTYNLTHKDMATGHYYNIMSLLIDNMDQEHQVSVYQKHAPVLLKSLLEWPWQDRFIQVAKKLGPYLSDQNYEDLALKISTKIEKDFKDYNYQVLLNKFENLRAAKDKAVLKK